jgi:hypothetical protein
VNRNVFTALCAALGYDTESVLSVRVNPREVVVTAVDDLGQLCATRQKHSGRALNSTDVGSSVAKRADRASRETS